MTIEETMLRQADFYNLNATMQEQSKVGHCELRNVSFSPAGTQPELRTISSFDPIANITLAPAYHLTVVFL